MLKNGPVLLCKEWPVVDTNLSNIASPLTRSSLIHPKQTANNVLKALLVIYTLTQTLKEKNLVHYCHLSSNDANKNISHEAYYF